uniref:Endosome-lysosome associated apoptosis and autophagy regulator family member 2 n=1 Tax=Salmo trutta TaxID=8032 RepID=A0A674CGS6_SALTR
MQSSFLLAACLRHVHKDEQEHCYFPLSVSDTSNQWYNSLLHVVSTLASLLQCAAGTYALGSGIRVNDWETIPTGFSSLATYLNNGPMETSASPATGFVMVPDQSPLNQYTDHNLFFDFFLEMDQTAYKKWLKITSHGEWVNLKSVTKILYWTTAGVLGAKVMKPVLLKNVHIEGRTYCFPCKPGTFSQTPGSSTCQPCPRDTHSGHGASSCTPCNTTTHYARSVCVIHALCMITVSSSSMLFLCVCVCVCGLTQVIYRWVEPQICLVSEAGGETLPPSGFYNNTATCSPCPPGTFADGVKGNKILCLAGTEPAVGYQFKWWNVVPANMKTSCINVRSSKCHGINGWEVAGDHICSGARGSDNDYLILNLHVPGFNGVGTVFGHIIFEFEMVCSADCELYFMMDINRKSWEGSKVRQSYTYIVTKNTSVSYTWAFQRTNQASEVSLQTLWTIHQD